MNQPSFSIVIPTYQRREIVCDAVRAIGDIRYSGSVEVIVVVDGSSDGTAEALEAIDCPFPMKIMRQDNSGAAAARNRGAANASGEILLFLDDDMMCRPDILEQHAVSHAADADAVLGDIPLDPQSTPGLLADGVAVWAAQRADRLKTGAAPGLFDLLSGHISVRRSVFVELGGFDCRFTSGGCYGNEDLDFGVRLLERYSVRFNPDAIAVQRYVVTPRDYLRQWHQAGRADVLFARKHPERAAELFRLHGSRRWTTRLLLRPLSAIGGLQPFVIAAAIRLAGKGARHRPRLLQSIQARLFAAARDIVYWQGVRDAGGLPSSRRMLVLCYHAIADLSGDPILADYGIDAGTFAAQLDALIARGFAFVSPDEAIALLEGSGRVPRKAVLLTFDDCYEELADVARTVLEPRGIQAIAFAVTGMPSGTNEWDQRIGARRLRLLDSVGLKNLHAHGVEIGCHSRSHRPLPTLGDTQLQAETAGAAGDIALLGLPRPRFFAYPHGRCDDRSRQAVRDAGFSAGFALKSAPASSASDHFAVPRLEILRRDVGWRFRFKTARPRLSVLLYSRTVLLTIGHDVLTVLRLKRGKALRT